LSSDRRRLDAGLTPLAFLPEGVQPRIRRLFSDEARNVLYDEFYAALDSVISDTLSRRLRPYISRVLEDLAAQVRRDVTEAVIREFERRGVLPSSATGASRPVSRPSAPPAESGSGSSAVEESSGSVARVSRSPDSALLPDETKLESEEFEKSEREGRSPFDEL